MSTINSRVLGIKEIEDSIKTSGSNLKLSKSIISIERVRFTRFFAFYNKITMGVGG